MIARGAPDPAAGAKRRAVEYSRLILVAVASDPHAAVADLILANGAIYTMDLAQPVAKAIALTAGAVASH